MLLFCFFVCVVVVFVLLVVLLVVVLVVGLVMCDLVVEEVNCQLVLMFYDCFFNWYEVVEVVVVVVDDYKQYNLYVLDGKQLFVLYFVGVFQKNLVLCVCIVCSVVDGDFVYLYVYVIEWLGDCGEVVVDIFCVKDGKIVEYWDVIQLVFEMFVNWNMMF